MTYIQTFSGVRFDLNDPQPECVRLTDIAVALSRINRFTGHTLYAPYSVAEHSVRVSHAVPARDAAWGLMHDAAEAYVGDVGSPLKGMLGATFESIEIAVLNEIRRKYRLDAGIPDSVRHADKVLLSTERRDLMVDSTDVDWGALPKPLTERIVPWSAEDACHAFLRRATELGIS